MDQTPQRVEVALFRRFHASSWAAVLQRSDSEILAGLKNAEGIGPKEIAYACLWLREQRRSAGELVGAKVDARARAEEWMHDARNDIARAVRRRLLEDGADAEDVARRCGTSTEVVRALLNGRAPSSFELVVRLALVLGVRVRVDVHP